MDDELDIGTGSAASETTAAPDSTSNADASAAPDYDWTAWDGNDESAPELYRPALSALRTHLKPTLDEHATIKRWYDALGEDDLEPMTEDLRKQIAENDAKLKEVQAKYEAAEKQAKDLQAAVDAEIDRIAREELQAFEQRHAALLKNPKVVTYLTAMVKDYDADPEFAIEALRLGKTAAQAFVDMLRRGATDAIAIEHARVVGKQPVATSTDAVPPRASAHLVHGSGEHTQRGGRIEPAAAEKPANLQEWRERALDRVSKKFNLAG